VGSGGPRAQRTVENASATGTVVDAEGVLGVTRGGCGSEKALEHM
jgi:hypothetical protein